MSDVWERAIVDAVKHADFLRAIAEVLEEEGLNAAPHTDDAVPPNYIRIMHEGRTYVVAVSDGNIEVRHVPPPVTIPLADPEVFKKVRKLCDRTWP